MLHCKHRKLHGPTAILDKFDNCGLNLRLGCQHRRPHLITSRVKKQLGIQCQYQPVLVAEVLSNSDFSPLILYFAIYFIANESSCTYGSLFKVHACLCSCRKTNLLKCQRRSEDYKIDGSIPRSRPVTLARTSR